MVKNIKSGLVVVFIFISIVFLAPACKMSYSFTGANLSPAIKTYTVYYFPNRARLVNPTLSQVFTEDLRDKLRRQTSLNELSENGDIVFEGQITGYEVRPMSIQKDDLAAQNRLTITVKLKYTARPRKRISIKPSALMKITTVINRLAMLRMIFPWKL